ncbi:hypothetical protein GUJ93_ZPchr0013g35471 [Zizania palustris]|uniref:Dirigent protein n=1 Tax=Zizania palustris TaxID=103762 RepID=A0A8J6C3E0_ZIZPA|nr:hypothetical protein GUJ93_ZPchr0013g35471 [Zizania palustris]
MAKQPFQSSTSVLMKALLLASVLSPWISGTNDATENTSIVVTNHASPLLLLAYEKIPLPLDASTASADTKPTMVSLPLICSSVGPLNVNMSDRFEALAALGLGLFGVARVGVVDRDGDEAMVSCVGSKPAHLGLGPDDENVVAKEVSGAMVTTVITANLQSMEINQNARCAERDGEESKLARSHF